MLSQLIAIAPAPTMDDDDGILNIELSDTEDVIERQANRTGQSEAEFQAVKAEYTAKVENGEIFKTIKLPLLPGVSKMTLQQVIHAIEELYYFRRYQEALDFIDTLNRDGSQKALDQDTRSQVETYEARCYRKLNPSS
ncbi:alpha beta hydrolase fold protein [Purpureocillium lavendulum]|uniref:Alpha beta hydrolase fold protein n=1 Tax=Purpureocillium lavendulum TaxID=1247861 RepID=A0AB34FM78_9HYPO|nr:alpha beta hydrolase fold protein [Purpureocillium lavendulum]